MKCSLSECKGLEIPTAGAFARCTLKAANLFNHLTALLGDMLEDHRELVEGQIADLATPDRFHARDIQVFKEYRIELIAQLVRQLEVSIAAFIGDANMRATDEFSRLATVVGAVPLFVFVRLQHAQSLRGVKMLQTGEVLFPV